MRVPPILISGVLGIRKTNSKTQEFPQGFIKPLEFDTFNSSKSTKSNTFKSK